MPAQRTDLIPIVQRSYDLCAVLYEHVNRFPRAQRPLLGRVILDDALQILVQLTLANRRADRLATLSDAGGRLDALRITLRLSKRLGFLSNGGYERLSGGVDEIGRMLGGWLKYESGPKPRTNSGGMSEPTPSAIADRPARRAGGVRYTMTSPTVEKYLRLKLDHSPAIVFVAVGAFYQTFFDDAATCGRELRFAVRNLAAESEPEKILVCGFPRAKLQKYVELLRQVGWETHAE